MKTKPKYQISKTFNLNIDNRLKYPIHNLTLLCKLLNYKTYKLNKLYLELLPDKINRLKTLKNFLLHYYKQYQINHVEAKQIGLIDILIEYSDLLNINTKQLSKKAFMESITKYQLKFIDKKIKHYQKELKHKKLYFDYKITQYDLDQLHQNKITYNIKAMFYFYMIALKKQKHTETNRFYYSGYVMTKTQKYSIREVIINYESQLLNQFETNQNIGFNEIIKPDLESFKNWFLTKTI